MWASQLLLSKSVILDALQQQVEHQAAIADIMQRMKRGEASEQSLAAPPALQNVQNVQQAQQAQLAAQQQQSAYSQAQAMGAPVAHAPVVKAPINLSIERDWDHGKVCSSQLGLVHASSHKGVVLPGNRVAL